nr:MAG TPA: hypothetical protein [Crassvirales sp.]
MEMFLWKYLILYIFLLMEIVEVVILKIRI